MTDDDAPDPETEELVGRHLAQMTPDPRPSWSSRLGIELEHERVRRGITARPTVLWLRVAVASVAGVLLLLVALTQV
jgi:hypothetical protein